jgi:hypothetical protein
MAAPLSYSAERVVEVLSPSTAPVIERERLIWHPAGATPALVIPLHDILRPA